MRKLGSAPLDEFADNGDDVMTQAIDHVVGDTSLMSQLRKGATLGQKWGKPAEVPSNLSITLRLLMIAKIAVRWDITAQTSYYLHGYPLTVQDEVEWIVAVLRVCKCRGFISRLAFRLW